MPTIEETIAYIKTAHDGQVTKGGDPYWTHPVAVMELLPPEASDDERHAALLHDVIEDCGVTANDLVARGYSQRVVDIVESVSRPPGLTYMQWIERLVQSGDVGAMRVKLADNEHNMQPDRIAKLPLGEQDIVRRYRRSARLLRDGLARHAVK